MSNSKDNLEIGTHHNPSSSAETYANDAEQQNNQKTEIPPAALESDKYTPHTTEDPETHEYATPRELSLLSTVFTIATFMIAIDGSIIGIPIQTLRTRRVRIVVDWVSNGHSAHYQRFPSARRCVVVRERVSPYGNVIPTDLWEVV